jgi:hypothetical protein
MCLLDCRLHRVNCTFFRTEVEIPKYIHTHYRTTLPPSLLISARTQSQLLIIWESFHGDFSLVQKVNAFTMVSPIESDASNVVLNQKYWVSLDSRHSVIFFPVQ